MTEGSSTQPTSESNRYAMEIKIVNHFTALGSEYYEWDLYEGPEGIDHIHGYATDLIQAFSKIIEWRERISLDYAEEITTTLTTKNETDSEPTN